MVMIRLNIHEAKTHLSRYLKRRKNGETIILCKRNIPIAEIRPIAEPPRKNRPIGLHKGLVHVPDSFFDRLPELRRDYAVQFLEPDEEAVLNLRRLPVFTGTRSIGCLSARRSSTA